jgi:hypothetical protein
VSSVEWDLFRKCPVCFAELGEPCTTLTGVAFQESVREVSRDRPHSRRKLRTGAVSR